MKLWGGRTLRLSRQPKGSFSKRTVNLLYNHKLLKLADDKFIIFLLYKKKLVEVLLTHQDGLFSLCVMNKKILFTFTVYVVIKSIKTSTVICTDRDKSRFYTYRYIK